MAVGVALLLAGAGAAAVLVRDDAPYPDEWDQRVLPFVEAVEEQRDLDFEHPVEVRFLSGKAFEKEVTTDEGELDADDRKEIRELTAVLRAVGLVSGDVDLLDAVNQASGAGTLAYYSDDDKRITIRGKELTTAVHATLVHELTHALQDQHFGIGARLDDLREAEEGAEDSTAAAVFQALVEGDAERVTGLYRESLPRNERRRLGAAEKQDQADLGPRLKGVPKVVQSLLSAPYVLGETMVDVVAEDGGNDSVDELYDDTPEHESALLDPFQVLEGDLGAVEVEPPDLEESEEELDSGAFGALAWYLVLAERIPVLDALTVVDGWGGDAYTSYERGRQTCVRIAYTGDTRGDTDRMRRALGSWVDAGPRGKARVRRSGGEVTLESCDPGSGARLGSDSSIKALKLAASRSYLGIGLLQAGAPTPVARCISGRAVEELPLSTLSGTPSPDAAATVRRQIQRLAQECTQQ